MGIYDMLKHDIDNMLADCECPYCHQTVTVSLNENGDTVTCPNCKESMSLTVIGYDDTNARLKEASDSLDSAFEEIAKTLGGR